MSARLKAVALASALAVFGAASAGTQSGQGALSAGGVAGVQRAQSLQVGGPTLLMVGGAAIITGVVLVATGSGNGSGLSGCVLAGCTAPTTTTTASSTTTTKTSTTTTTKTSSTTTSTSTH